MKRCAVAIALIASLIVSYSFQSNAQSDPKSFTPPSPNTASLGEYGRIDVGLNTGRANVSIPLHQIKGKDLQLSVDLSHHGGGIKVEEASTWVGLGWSLNAGGVITREIRNLPDEIGGGVMDSEYPIYLEGQSMTETVKDGLFAVIMGSRDMEPDMFYFNFAGQSGRFIYDKPTGQFVTIPKSKKKITFDNNQFTVVTEDGSTYWFPYTETNNVSSFCQYSPNQSRTSTTGWYLASMTNANATETFNFYYETSIYTFNTLVGERKAYLINGPPCEEFAPSYNGPPCYQQNQIITQRLDSITYSGGRVEFIKHSSPRCDLPGDYALDHIDIYNENNEKYLTYDFHQSYFQSNVSSATACELQPEESRLRLDSITRSADSATELYRKLEYSTTFVPSRYSKSMDYWGYYNGKNNSSLVPTVYLTTSTGLMKFPGANREASTSTGVNDVGMLKRIYYPTRGYTEFEYENHRINAASSIVTDYGLSRFDFQGYGKPGPRFDTTFVINEVPSALNGGQWGAYVTIDIAGVSCNFGPPASTGCAEIGFTGPKSATLTGDITEQDGYFLPNGTYTLTADFTSNPNTLDWMEFFIRIEWKHETTTNKDNSAIGGLRIKQVTDVDPFSGTTRQQNFTYTLEGDSVSSAYIREPMTFGRTVQYKAQCGLGPLSGGGHTADLRYCERYEVGAGSNYPMIGIEDAVAYSYVTVKEDIQGRTGKTIHEFMTYPDMVYTTFPFCPPIKYDWKRGQPKRTREYKRVGSNYTLLKDKEYTYKSIDEYHMYGCRVVVDIVCADNSYSKSWFDYGGWYMVASYDMANGYFHNDSIITRTYDDAARAIQSYQVNRLDRNDLVIQGTETIDGQNNKIITWNKYVNDYPNTAAPVITWQKSRNINNLIERSTWKKSGSDSTFLSADLSLYTIDNSNHLVLDESLHRIGPASFATSFYTGSTFHSDNGYVRQVKFLQYNDKTNPQTYVERNGVQNAIYWNTTRLYPIATVVNSTHSDIFHTSFEEDPARVAGNAVTGDYYYSGTTYQIPAAYRPSGSNLKMTYWYYHNTLNKWMFKTEVPYSYTISDPNASRYDEIRVYPAGALMTTYTYHPGIGVISTTDPNNRVTRYKYDPFGRLTVVKDQDGNIVKTNTYHLAIGSND